MSRPDCARTMTNSESLWSFAGRSADPLAREMMNAFKRSDHPPDDALFAPQQPAPGKVKRTPAADAARYPLTHACTLLKGGALCRRPARSTAAAFLSGFFECPSEIGFQRTTQGESVVMAGIRQEDAAHLPPRAPLFPQCGANRCEERIPRFSGRIPMQYWKDDHRAEWVPG